MFSRCQSLLRPSIVHYSRIPAVRNPSQRAAMSSFIPSNVPPAEPTTTATATQTPNATLALPEPPAEDDHIKLDMSTGTAEAKLDSLGPLVVNENGTVSRINNWGQMSEIEQQNTLRILGKRNKMRLAKLRGEKAA